MPSINQLTPLVKPSEVIDRDDQWQSLEAIWTSDAPELVFGFGRRRAGKSWVLARFAKAVGGIYYQATRRTEAEQLATLSQILGAHYADAALQAGVSFAGWEKLFEYLVAKSAGSPLLLVLDEFPSLATASPALTSIIQKAWDREWAGSRLKLVLNGSHITAMRQLEGHDQPLFGRRTGRIDFPPFVHEHVAAFVPQYDPQEQVRTAAIFGGLPGHLSLLDAERSLAENVSRQMLTASGRLRDEAQHMLDAFLRDAHVHYSILQAIAHGERKWTSIANRLGTTGGVLSRPMRWLEEMQLVSRRTPITEADPARSKRARYYITDPYVAFWHQFIAPLASAGDIGLVEPRQLWEERVAPGLDAYMGTPFEEICRSWVRRTPRLPFRPSRVGSWWNDDSSEEIDIVATGPEGHVLVGECNWGPVEDSNLATLRRRAELVLPRLSFGKYNPKLTLAVFSGRGQWGTGVARAIGEGEILGFTSADLMDL